MDLLIGNKIAQEMAQNRNALFEMGYWNIVERLQLCKYINIYLIQFSLPYLGLLITARSFGIVTEGILCFPIHNHL